MEIFHFRGLFTENTENTECAEDEIWHEDRGFSI